VVGSEEQEENKVEGRHYAIEVVVVVVVVQRVGSTMAIKLDDCTRCLAESVVQLGLR
jgi:hypothetical protein